MENKQLHLKYAEGRHWDNHPIEYAEYFSSLLFRQGLAGPVIDIGCSSGKDAEILQKKGLLLFMMKMKDILNHSIR